MEAGGDIGLRMGGAAGCLAMMITISTSGGIGGFGLAKSAEVAVDSLPEPLRVEACARLDPKRSARSTRRRCAGPPTASSITSWSWRGAADGPFDLPESALPAETLDLIDELLAIPTGR